eukprot:1145358-Pelagomonas_calceolata.AAC.1
MLIACSSSGSEQAHNATIPLQCYEKSSQPKESRALRKGPLTSKLASLTKKKEGFTELQARSHQPLKPKLHDCWQLKGLQSVTRVGLEPETLADWLL